VLYLLVYTRVTPHDEFKLIRDNDPAAPIVQIAVSRIVKIPVPNLSKRIAERSRRRRG